MLSAIRQREGEGERERTKFVDLPYHSIMDVDRLNRTLTNLESPFLATQISK